MYSPEPQSAMSYLTFTIAGKTVKVDPDIYYQIFNVKNARPRRKYVGNITGLCISGENYPHLLIGRKPARNVPISRFIMKPPKRMVVDHINGDRLDNRRENLRICTLRQNSLNRKYKTNTGFFGVNVYKKGSIKYCRARFCVAKGKSLYFETRDCHFNRILAAYVHDKFVLQSGDEEYAPLNFDSFRYEPFRSFLLNEDLSKYKLKSVV